MKERSVTVTVESRIAGEEPIFSEARGYFTERNGKSVLHYREKSENGVVVNEMTFLPSGVMLERRGAGLSFSIELIPGKKTESVYYVMGLSFDAVALTRSCRCSGEKIETVEIAYDLTIGENLQKVNLTLHIKEEEAL